MFADWSCTVLVHKRTCCGKYRISKVSIDLCNCLISGTNVYISKVRMYISIEYECIYQESTNVYINKVQMFISIKYECIYQ